LHGTPRLTPEILLRAYAEGLFPMAERRGDPTLYWVSPERRGIIPLDSFHVPHRLARTVRAGAFAVTADQAFREVIQGCAAPVPGREESWINSEILRLYTALHISGHAHSIECRQAGELVGGLYGVRLGAAFFGESMFSRRTDASKVALVHLVATLKLGGFTLLDTQFLTPHLAHFGAVEIAREIYMEELRKAIAGAGYWPASSGSAVRPSLSEESGDSTLAGALDATAAGAAPGTLVLQLITQTS
jgi:leucyl/phenylalanyl-tRNA--protein transferase